MGLYAYMKHEKCHHCGGVVGSEPSHLTYNTSHLWYEMYPDDDEMIPIDGQTGEFAVTRLTEAYHRLLLKYQLLVVDGSKFRTVENADTLLRFLKEAAMLSTDNPDSIWVIER